MTKSRRKRSRLEKNLTRITFFELSKDNHGKFILYCHKHSHIGIVGEIKAEECIKGNCKYYQIFRGEQRKKINQGYQSAGYNGPEGI